MIILYGQACDLEVPRRESSIKSVSSHTIEHRIANLDLNPGNVVRGSHDFLKINFGLSMFVKNEHIITVKGFCGTPTCVAQEVGKRDGLQPDPSPCRSVGV